MELLKLLYTVYRDENPADTVGDWEWDSTVRGRPIDMDNGHDITEQQASPPRIHDLSLQHTVFVYFI